MTVKLDHLSLPGYIPQRYISYRGNRVDLTQTEFNKVIENLPEKFFNEVEKLYSFIVKTDSDGNTDYFTEIEKKFFDFRTREYITKKTKINISVEERNFLYRFFKDSFNVFYIEKADDFYNKILGSIGDISVAADKLRSLRDEFLRESDKYMLIDFPISPEEREMWLTYRQELRELTSQDAWPDDIENIKFPISPEPERQAIALWSRLNISDIIGNQLNVNDLRNKLFTTIEKYASLSVKVGVLSSLSSLNIPLFREQNLLPEEIAQIESDLTSIATGAEYESFVLDNEFSGTELENKYHESLRLLDEKINYINSKLSECNANFTVNDIIEQVVKDSVLTNEANKIIDNL